MNWETIQGNWDYFRGEIQTRWGKLTPEDLDIIEGRQEKMVGRLRKRYGILEDEAEMEIDDFLNDPRYSEVTST